MHIPFNGTSPSPRVGRNATEREEALSRSSSQTAQLLTQELARAGVAVPRSGQLLKKVEEEVGPHIPEIPQSVRAQGRHTEARTLEPTHGPCIVSQRLDPARKVPETR